MPGGNGGSVVGFTGAAFVLVLLTAMTLDVFSGFWDTLVENKGPVIMVALGLLIAWFSLRDDIGSSGAAGPLGRPGASGRGQLAGAPAQPRPSSTGMAPAGSKGSSGSGGATNRQQQERSGGGSGAGSKALSLRREDSASGKLGAPTDTPPRRRKVQGNVRNSTVEMVAVSTNGSSSKHGSGSGSMALVRADDASSALARTAGCTLMCSKPAGCGYRHACLDLGRRWMRCDKHGSHPLPPNGSVWREVVPEREAGGRSLRLCLAWEGTALDVTGLGACRGWDKEMTAAVCALLDSGRRVSGMCSQSPSFPMLRKWQEVAAMDYRAAARGRRLLSMFERWLAAKNGSGGSKPLAIEMGSRVEG
ncbi:collagen alpha-1(XII) chain-like isoform X1 [Chlorella sorokiniana]|uniref:Collagen alpha-1(XII) chain-like isoform X1 n=1 Tax=Chlorella sorokiniana TaxID=3076 RepID=A0A2P6TYA4_CHLSO|nr:collagen alpha-1(XII) chain-like isoform X1 [Chlorella sorokiniana]|eukprot:PRW59057.1 collagen alpha-1(XII) chain-like isoform X1 [Chlorella sorokiniana]